MCHIKPPLVAFGALPLFPLLREVRECTNRKLLGSEHFVGQGCECCIPCEEAGDYSQPAGGNFGGRAVQSSDQHKEGNRLTRENDQNRSCPVQFPFYKLTRKKKVKFRATEIRKVSNQRQKEKKPQSAKNTLSP